MNLNEYSPRERIEIAALVDEICSQSWPWSDDFLVGQWMLSHLQPGPDGAGIDRRIPFPEFYFNDSFQIFDDNNDGLAVRNVGQVLGSLVEVRVAGSLQREIASQKVATPTRFLASIQRGELCVFGSGTKEDETRMCLQLPISHIR